VGQVGACWERANGGGSLRDSAILAIGMACCLVAACGGGVAEGRGGGSAAASTPAGDSTPGGTVPHGNHNPKYGGVVLMNGDVHFEVVLRRDGKYQVYFSDATRSELPASIASQVTVTVMRPGTTPEPVTLQIDDSGESWVGQGKPVPLGDSTARVAYSSHGQPYWIDVPFAP
jgi:hypothetical protein